MSKAWPKVRLGEMLTHYQEYIESPELKIYPKLSVKLYGKGVTLDAPADGAALRMKRHQLAKAGQVILSEIWGKKGAVGFVPLEGDGALCTSHFFLFDVRADKLDSKWLQAIFTANYLQEQLDAEAKGTTGYAAVRPKILFACEIPLPPLAEQRRIVARIEELAAQINEARTLRHHAVEEAEALTRSHLNRLFGDFYNGVEGTLAIDRWEKLDAVVDDIADGPHVTPTYVPDGIPFITVLNITSGRIRFGDHKFITPEDHAEYQRRAKAERGDVLISKDGTIGMPCLVDTDRPFSFFVSVALVKPKRGVLDGEFLTWAIRAPYLQDCITARSRGDMIRHLVLREIRDLTIPVPSLREQRKIVAELEALQEKVDALKRVQTETAAELDALLPAVLDRAFKGQL